MADMSWLKAGSFSSSDDFTSDRGGREVDISFATPPAFTALTSADPVAPPAARAGASAAAVPPSARNREFRFYNLEPDGALRPGGARALFSPRSAGLLVTYAAVGALYGALPALVSPFFRSYLSLPSFQVQAARRVLDAPWLWKVAGGALSDALPVRGLRRKPYMALGWTIAFLALAFLGFVAEPDPAPEVSASGSGSGPVDEVHQNVGWMYLAIMGVATVGALVANVAADGLVVEWAQRESLAKRGRTQTAAFATRCLFMFVADFLVGTLLNSADFGGDFSWDVGVNALFLALAVLALVALISAVWMLEEDRVYAPGFCGDDSAGAATATTAESTPGPVHEYELYGPGDGDDDDAVLHDASLTPRRRRRLLVTRLHLWRLAQSRAVWTLLLFSFLSTLLFAISPISASAFMSRWYLAVDLDARTVADLVKGVVYTLSLLATQRFLQPMGWTTVYICATLWVVLVRVLLAAATVFNLVRSPWLVLYGTVLSSPAAAARQLMVILPIAETAPRGLEATTYGLVITFFNFGLMLADAATKWLSDRFGIEDISADDVDTVGTRWIVMSAFLAAFAVNLASLGAVMFLPRQRLEVQQLRYYGGYSVGAAAVVALGVLLALGYSVVTVAFASVEKTSCLRIAGGVGC